jgi:protein-S-isoprenylcysteine O-methyltransferase Ste14
MAPTDMGTAGGATPAGIQSQREELDIYQHRRRLALALVVALAVPALLVGQSSFPPGTVYQETLEYTGILMIFMGIVGRLWSTLYIGGRKGTELVTAGPYSITRNPLYLFSTLAVAGIGAQTGSFVAMLCFAGITIGAFSVVIRREERYLRDALGAAYASYCARVPRFWPDVSLYDDAGPEVVEPRRLRRTLLDGLLFFLVVPLFDLVDRAQLAGLLPVLFRLP